MHACICYSLIPDHQGHVAQCLQQNQYHCVIRLRVMLLLSECLCQCVEAKITDTSKIQVQQLLDVSDSCLCHGLKQQH